QGDAQPPPPPPARRAHRLDRSVQRARHSRRHRQIRRQRTVRSVVDEPQHGRGGGGVRTGAVPLAWADRARGRSEDAARAEWRGEPRRSLRQCRPRDARRRTQTMNASRVGAIVVRMAYLYRGSPQRVFPIFIFVAVDILIWGFMTRYLNSVPTRGSIS